MIAPAVTARRAAHAQRLVAVSKLGDTAARRLARGLIDRVHSVFARAVNLAGADGRLVTLHAPGPLAAPFAIAIGALPPWGELEPGAPVVCGGAGRLDVGALSLDWAAARIVETSIGAGSDPGALAGALAEAPDRPMAPSLSSPRALEARRRLTEGLRRGDAEQFAAGARRLIGLGEGLTPAGDDLLVGCLAVIRRFRPAFAADERIAGALAEAARDGTTAVAREFVLEALEGRFSELVVAVASAADAASARAALADVLELGATSGADTVAGMDLALAALVA